MIQSTKFYFFCIFHVFAIFIFGVYYLPGESRQIPVFYFSIFSNSLDSQVQWSNRFWLWSQKQDKQREYHTFSSSEPLDVMERARMNSLNSMAPSWTQTNHDSTNICNLAINFFHSNYRLCNFVSQKYNIFDHFKLRSTNQLIMYSPYFHRTLWKRS